MKILILAAHLSCIIIGFNAGIALSRLIRNRQLYDKSNYEVNEKELITLKKMILEDKVYLGLAVGLIVMIIIGIFI